MKTVLSAIVILLTAIKSHAAVQAFSYNSNIGLGGTRVVWGETEPETGISLTFSVTATMNVHLDVETSMIRVFGSIPASTRTIEATQTVEQLLGYGPPQFPNPPMPIYATGVLEIDSTLTIPATSFDTGFRPYAWNGSAYAFDGALGLGAMTTQLEVAYKLTADGQSFENEETFLLNYFFNDGLRFINVSNYPSSVSVPNFLQVGIAIEDVPVEELGTVSASNGLDLQIAVIPEPSGALLMAIAVGLFATSRKRRAA